MRENKRVYIISPDSNGNTYRNWSIVTVRLERLSYMIPCFSLHTLMVCPQCSFHCPNLCLLLMILVSL
jgi:hypothetical protein